MARRDSEGYLWYVGRADDVFKSSDYRISPFELESVAGGARGRWPKPPWCLSPDAVRAAVPKAFLALAPGATGDRETMLSIFRHVRERLAPFKRVRRLEVFDLPKTISGKMRRVELRQAEEAWFCRQGTPRPRSSARKISPELK